MECKPTELPPDCQAALLSKGLQATIVQRRELQGRKREAKAAHQLHLQGSSLVQMHQRLEIKRACSMETVVAAGGGRGIQQPLHLLANAEPSTVLQVQLPQQVSEAGVSAVDEQLRE